MCWQMNCLCGKPFFCHSSVQEAIKKLSKPQSEPPSPSVSRSSSPPPTTEDQDLEDDEADSEEEREELSKVETPNPSSGRQTPTTDA